MSKPVPVLYLDLDDTVRKGKDALGRFVNSVEDVDVFPEAIAQMKKAKKQGWRIVGITNQGGVAMGYMSMDTLNAIMAETQKQTGNLFDKIMACVHFPEASDPEMSICWCRKPRAGLVIEAAITMGNEHPDEYYPPHMALFVGDREEDAECAEAANVQFLDAVEWRSPETLPSNNGLEGDTASLSNPISESDNKEPKA